MLSDSERHQLLEIERFLSAEDPRLARQLRGSPGMPRRMIACAAIACVPIVALAFIDLALAAFLASTVAVIVGSAALRRT